MRACVYSVRRTSTSDVHPLKSWHCQKIKAKKRKKKRLIRRERFIYGRIYIHIIHIININTQGTFSTFGKDVAYRKRK